LELQSHGNEATRRDGKGEKTRPGHAASGEAFQDPAVGLYRLDHRPHAHFGPVYEAISGLNKRIIFNETTEWESPDEMPDRKEIMMKGGNRKRKEWVFHRLAVANHGYPCNRPATVSAFRVTTAWRTVLQNLPEKFGNWKIALVNQRVL
jgi:hypothetical protein